MTIAAAALAIGACSSLPAPSVVGGARRARVEAVAHLLEMEDRRLWDAPLATAAAGSADAVLRERAALAAGRVRPDDAATLLARLLSDREPRVRRGAAFAAGAIRSSFGDYLVAFLMAGALCLAAAAMALRIGRTTPEPSGIEEAPVPA